MQITSTTLLFIALGIVIVLIAICFIIIASMSSKINTLMEYSEDGDIIDAIKTYYDKVSDLTTTVNEASDAVLLSRLANCEQDSNISLKKIGIVNFDAFDDVKGNLSFALAILNNNNDGFILTSLYGHNSCNTYVREIVGGEPAIKLLNEENEALEKAKNKLKRAEE